MSTTLDEPLPTAAIPWFTLGTDLLVAIAAHPAFPTEGANNTFKSEIDAIRAALEADTTPQQATITSIDVQEALARYAQHAEVAIGSLTSQLREIADLLLAYGQAQGTDPSLEELRQKILLADDPNALKELRGEIITRLELTQRQTEEQIKRGQELTEKLQDRIALLEKFATAAPPPPSLVIDTGVVTTDPCTGLPDWREADRAIERVVNEKREVSVAVFYVHRMNYVNARFGSVIGDKILFVCSQHLATALVRPTDALYRWKGPAFVAILEREPQTNPENDIQRLLATPLSQYLETPSRTVYLPIKLTGRTVPQTETSLASMRDWIEGFILRSSLDSRLPD
jgi:GGDEF domain-containing protein